MASLVGITIIDKFTVAGKMIREIDIPKECVVAAIIREYAFVVPRGETRIHNLDRVIFIGPTAAIKQAQAVISVKI